MAFGKPVVIPESRASARVVRESKCGRIFAPGSVKSFAKAVIDVHKNPSHYGENGYIAIRDKYNWENTEKELLRLYLEIS